MCSFLCCVQYVVSFLVFHFFRLFQFHLPYYMWPEQPHHNPRRYEWSYRLRGLVIFGHGKVSYDAEQDDEKSIEQNWFPSKMLHRKNNSNNASTKEHEQNCDDNYPIHNALS